MQVEPYDRSVRVVLWVSLGLIAALCIASLLPGIDVSLYGQYDYTAAAAPWLSPFLAITAFANAMALIKRTAKTPFASPGQWGVLALVGIAMGGGAVAAATEQDGACHALWPRVFVVGGMWALAAIFALVVPALLAIPRPHRLERGSTAMRIAYTLLACDLAVAIGLAVVHGVPGAAWLAVLAVCVGAVAMPAAISCSYRWFVPAAATAFLGACMWLAHFGLPRDDAAVRIAAGSALALGIVIPIVAAFAVRASIPYSVQAESVRARRMRPLASLMLLVAAAVSVLAFAPGATRHGSATFVATVLALFVGPALIVRARPDGRDHISYIQWLLLAVPALALLVMCVPHHTRGSWPAAAVDGGLCILIVLIGVVMPILLVISPGEVTPRVSVPRAVASRRARAT